MVNVLSGSEVGKSRRVNYVTLKLYNLEEEEAEITDREIMELGSQKEVDEKEDVGGNKCNARRNG